MEKARIIVLVVGVLFVCIGGVQAVTIDWVTVGNPGNAKDGYRLWLLW